MTTLPEDLGFDVKEVARIHAALAEITGIFESIVHNFCRSWEACCAGVTLDAGSHILSMLDSIRYSVFL